MSFTKQLNHWISYLGRTCYRILSLLNKLSLSVYCSESLPPSLRAGTLIFNAFPLLKEVATRKGTQMFTWGREIQIQLKMMKTWRFLQIWWWFGDLWRECLISAPGLNLWQFSLHVNFSRAFHTIHWAASLCQLPRRCWGCRAEPQRRGICSWWLGISQCSLQSIPNPLRNLPSLVERTTEKASPSFLEIQAHQWFHPGPVTRTWLTT